jgi:hypothetical protein
MVMITSGNAADDDVDVDAVIHRKVVGRSCVERMRPNSAGRRKT